MANISHTIAEEREGRNSDGVPTFAAPVRLAPLEGPLGDAYTDGVADALSQSSLFSGLDDEILRRMATHVRVRTFSRGQAMAWEGAPARAVYVIVRGEARVYRVSLEGREYVLNHMGPGEVFGLVPVFDGGVNVATLESVAETTVFAIPCERFREIGYDQPKVAKAILQHLAGQVRQTCDKAENLALHPVRTRLARFLLSSTSDDARPSRYWTQEEIAAHIGTVRDVVGRTLRSFSGEGLVRRERTRLVVTDQAGVRREAMR